MPLGHSEWTNVVNHFNQRVEAGRKRDKAGSQRKNNDMVSHRKPTGDSACPWHIREAKIVDKLRNQKTRKTSMGTEQDNLTSDDSEDDDILANDDDVNVADLLMLPSSSSPFDSAGSSAAFVS